MLVLLGLAKGFNKMIVSFSPSGRECHKILFLSWS